MLLNGDRAGGGVIADLVDLQQGGAVRQVRTQDGATRVDGVEGLGRSAGGLGEDGLGEDDVLDRVAVRRLAMEELHVGGHLVAEAVAALRSDLLDGGAVRLEPERTRREAHLAVRLGDRERFAAAAVAGVDPTVGREDEVVGDEVGVARREAAVKDLLLVGLAVAIGIAEPDDVRLADDDDAVLVVTESGDELQSFVEELLLVGDAVAIGVDQHADLILRGTVVAARDQHPALTPGLGGQRTTTVRIFRGLGDPHATALVPLHGDGLVDQGFGDHDAGLEARLHLERGDGLLGAAGAADRITEVDEVILRAEFVHVGAAGRPGDAAFDEGPVAGVGERGGIALQEDGGTETGILEDPGLRLDVIDGGLVGDFGDVLTVGADLGGEGRSQDVDLFV